MNPSEFEKNFEGVHEIAGVKFFFRGPAGSEDSIVDSDLPRHNGFVKLASDGIEAIVQKAWRSGFNSSVIERLVSDSVEDLLRKAPDFAQLRERSPHALCAARQGNDDFSVDEYVAMSHGDDGCWVQSWTWVSDDEAMMYAPVFEVEMVLRDGRCLLWKGQDFNEDNAKEEALAAHEIVPDDVHEFIVRSYPRFLHSEGWGHIFSANEETTRWAIDRCDDVLVVAQVKSRGDWVNLSRAQALDLLDSLLNANDVLDEDVLAAGDFGEQSISMPEWSAYSWGSSAIPLDDVCGGHGRREDIQREGR